MIGLLADHNIIQQAELIWSLFSPADWQAMNVAALFQFSDVGLSVTASDREVWQKCQSSHLLLLTANRNARGQESLAEVIAELNHSNALPVLTVASPDSLKEFAYCEDCA